MSVTFAKVGVLVLDLYFIAIIFLVILAVGLLYLILKD